MNNIIIKDNIFLDTNDYIKLNNNIIDISNKVNSPVYLYQEEEYKEKIIINVESNTNLVLYEKFNSIDIELNIGDNSNIEIYTLLTGTNVNKKINVNNNINIKGINFSLSNGNLDFNFLVNIYGRKSVINYKTLCISSLEEIHNNYITVNHLSPNSESYTYNYGIANNNSKLRVYNTNVIEEKMSKSITRQSSKGVIVTEGARVEVKPTLTIFENDVIASHGATIGKISDEGLFYLMSRGLTKSDAVNLIIKGYIDPLIKEVLNDEFKTNVLNQIKPKI